jgi:hypothetical protein
VKLSTHASREPLLGKSKRADRIRESINQFVRVVNELENIDIKLVPKRQARQLLTSKQAGRLLGLAPKTLANWRTNGNGPAFYKVGGKCLYRRTDILLFAQSRKFESTSAYSAAPQHGSQQS